jgi:putative tryptophan/tyrosine transport system substrate-binding protein
VRLQPDAILARTTPVTAALLRETKTIPIVFVNVSDPVGAGFADSMARPGGSATGFTNVEASLGGKWVQVLKELDPQIASVGVIFGPKTSPAGGAFYHLGLVQAAAQSLDLQTAAMPAQDDGELARAIEAFARQSRGALVVQPDVTTTTHRKLIITLAARHRLPAVYPFRFFVREGGLAAYGIDVIDVYRRAAVYVDRIVRGDKPGELPIQAPTKFELAINLATAKELGLSVSPALLARADEVIE